MSVAGITTQFCFQPYDLMTYNIMCSCLIYVHDYCRKLALHTVLRSWHANRIESTPWCHRATGSGTPMSPPTITVSPCVNPRCLCDSYNGQHHQDCCHTCRDRSPCVQRFHYGGDQAIPCARPTCPCNSHDGRPGSCCIIYM